MCTHPQYLKILIERGVCRIPGYEFFKLTHEKLFAFGLLCCFEKEKMREANRRSCNTELCFPAVSKEWALLLRPPRISES